MKNQTTTSMGSTFRYSLILIPVLFCLTNAKAQKRVQQFDLNKRTSAFEENKGQIKSDISGDVPRYSGYSQGVKSLYYPNKLQFQFLKFTPVEKGQHGQGKSEIAADISMQLINANPYPQIIAEDKNSGYANYYFGENSEAILKIASYKKLTYKNIYNGIDMVLLPSPHGIKYSFVIHPGANAADIKLQWQGLDKINALPDGGLAYSVSGISFNESKPYTYNAEGKNIQTETSINGNTIGYALGSYDKTSTITIDPTLDWATYFGSSGNDGINEMANDTTDHYYLMGNWNSFPFFAKFNLAGSLDWINYYSGTLNDMFVEKMAIY